MAHPSGNEGIQRGHWLRVAVLIAVALLGTLALVWVNLASIVAAYRPGWGGTGPLGIAAAVFQVHWIWKWATEVLWPFQKAAFPWFPVSFLGAAMADPRHVAWMYWWHYATLHMIGAPAAPPQTMADYTGMIGLNAFLWMLLAVLPAWFASEAVDRWLADNNPDRRPGTAAWAPPADLRPYLQAVDRLGSLPLGRIGRKQPAGGREIALPLRDRDASVSRFSHVALWGVTEAGKTSGVYKPWLLADFRMNDPSQVDRDGTLIGAMSSLAIDMKHPDLYETLAPYAHAFPRRVLVLAPGDPERSLHYNPLDFVVDRHGWPVTEEIQLLVDVLFLNTPYGTFGDSSFHVGRERYLLELLIQYVCELQAAIDRGMPGAVDNLGSLQSMLLPLMPATTSIPPLRSLPLLAHLVKTDAKALLGQLGATTTDPNMPDAWGARVRSLQALDKHGTFTSGWVSDLERRLRIFASPMVAGISTRSDFSLDVLGRQPTTMIIGMPGTPNAALASYSALIITQLIANLRALAMRSQRRLPVPVTFYLDELANQGRIPQLEEDIATVRDFGIAFVLGIQNTAQLDQRYGEDAATSILSNTNTKIVLGRNLGFEDAEKFARATGDTTLLAHSASHGSRGGAHNQSESRRAFRTPDQIRRMNQYEALVFLQNGRFTQTRLVPFYEAPKHTRLPALPDQRYLEGTMTPDGNRIPPVVLLRHRHRTLNESLGHWDVRPPRPAVPLPTVSAVPIEPTEAVSALAEIADRARRELPASELGRDTSNAPSLGEPPPGPEDTAVPDHESAGPTDAEAPTLATASPASAATTHRQPDAEGVQATSRVTPKAEPSGSIRAGPPSGAESGDDWAAVSSLVGFFNTLTQGKLKTSRDGETNGIAPGWRLQAPLDRHTVVRWDYVIAYGERARTRATDIAVRWRDAGYVFPKHLEVDEHGGHVVLVAFTPAAFDRLTAPAKESVRSWPALAPGRLLGLDPAPSRAAAPSAAAPTRTVATPSPAAPAPSAASSKPGRPPKKTDAAEALATVIAWAQANATALKTRASLNLGQWEAYAQEELVLLVRQSQLNRILLQHQFDLKAVLEAWRQAGVIVTQDRRFTVYARVNDMEQRGARFIAFRWNRLEATGLARE